MSTVGVVIPALNEAKTLPDLLGDLRKVALPLDITVVDGGSRDDTVALARTGGAAVVSAPRGRALQMNTGAGGLRTDWLCFLHADVRLCQRARDDLVQLVADPDAEAAVWRLAIDADGWWYRIVERGAMVRDRVGGLPYGDQGLLVRRALFESLGGFPDVPVLEDVAFVRNLRRRAKLQRLASPMLVSGRRWRTEGPYRTWVRNATLLAAFLIGVPPRRLAKWYRPRHP